ncbi:MAG: transposase [Armatimonadetes bacterium]|nr:transposase [Armatimonadota bacterium]
MQLTTVVQLQTTPAIHAALVQTLRACNLACDRISRDAFDSQTFRKYDLPHLTYHPVRAETQLAAGHVVCAIAKVAHAYKRDTATLRTFQPLGGIELNKDTLAWKVEEQAVSINAVGGRLKISFLCSAAQKERLRGKRGQADLLLRDGQFYLSVAVTVAEAEPFAPQGVIGVDLGIVNVATDSEGNTHTGEAVQRVRRKYRRLRQLLQPKKTRSARKHLQKARRKESRFVKNENHRISKELVCLATDRQKALALEALTGIRQRGNGLNRAARTELNAWAFYQLGQFLAYKARRAGVLLMEVDPRYSSQTCSRCGHCDRANRKTQEKFECRCCGFQTNADFNAALNLKARATLSAGLMFREEAHASNQGQAVSFSPDYS